MSGVPRTATAARGQHRRCLLDSGSRIQHIRILAVLWCGLWHGALGAFWDNLRSMAVNLCSSSAAANACWCRAQRACLGVELLRGLW